MAKVLNGMDEVWRYFENGKRLLEDARPDYDSGTYNDPKYVKLAGHAFYSAVLIAINLAFPINKGKGREDVKDFRDALKKDKKALKMFNGLYTGLHLGMGYDGSINIKSNRGYVEDTEIFLEYLEDRWIYK